jgi:plasmid maintenance system killer protein
MPCPVNDDETSFLSLRNALRQFFETGSTAGIQASLARKLRLQLAALHSST